MYQSMYQHQTQWELYGFDRLRPLVFRWTSESAQLDILQYLFETTVQLLSDIAPPQNPSDPTFDLYEMVKGQMRDIAAIMLSAFQEREDLLVMSVFEIYRKFNALIFPVSQIDERKRERGRSSRV
jgi:hypothetical protein